MVTEVTAVTAVTAVTELVEVSLSNRQICLNNAILFSVTLVNKVIAIF